MTMINAARAALNPLVLTGVVSSAPIANPVGLSVYGRSGVRVSVYLGAVTANSTITFQLQHSNGFGFWTAIPGTVTVSSKTAVTSTVAASNPTITATAHGLSVGAKITPRITLGNLEAGEVYTVTAVPDANSLQIAPLAGQGAMIPQASGSLSFNSVTEVILLVNSNDSAQAAILPLANALRVVATSTDAADIVQTVAVHVGGSI